LNCENKNRKARMKDILYFTQRIQKQLIKAELGECWLWTGATNAKGYGVFCDRAEAKRNRSPHRDFFELVKKTKLTKDACHMCDEPRCINPDHIYDGDAKQNKADAVNRQRITPKKIRGKTDEIIRLFKDGVEQKEIAKRLGVCDKTILRFLNGQMNQYTHNYVKEAEEERNKKIKELFEQGKSLSEIMIEVRTPASVVWTIVPEIKERDKGKESSTNLSVKASLGIEERNRQIKEKREGGTSVTELAREYGVSAQLIYKIVR